MCRYFLGVDVGATKSHALVADNLGQALGLGTGGCGNPDSVGYDGFAEVIRDATDEALATAGVTGDEIAGAGFGVGGYDWPSQREPILQAIGTLGLSAPLELVNDAVIGLMAGAKEGWGVAVVAGTSCNCWGWDRERRIGRMTGHSWLGEPGKRSLQAAPHKGPWWHERRSAHPAGRSDEAQPSAARRLRIASCKWC